MTRSPGLLRSRKIRHGVPCRALARSTSACAASFVPSVTIVTEPTHSSCASSIPCAVREMMRPGLIRIVALSPPPPSLSHLHIRSRGQTERERTDWYAKRLTLYDPWPFGTCAFSLTSCRDCMIGSRNGAALRSEHTACAAGQPEL